HWFRRTYQTLVRPEHLLRPTAIILPLPASPGAPPNHCRALPSGMPLRIYRRRLPHWRLEGATYFVTWRLHRRQGDLTPHERTMVTGVILHWESVRFVLHALVVMNDHVHVLVTPHPGTPLERLVQGWKAFAADQLRQNG